MKVKIIACLFFLPVFCTFAEITVALFNGPEPVIIVNNDGTATGFYPELLRTIFKDEDITFITGLSFQEAYEKVVNNEIDLLPAVIKTPERERVLKFNREVSLASWGEVLIKSESSIDDLFDLKNKKIALMKEDQNGKNFIKLMNSFNLPFIPVYNNDYDEMSDAVINNDVIGMVTFNTYQARAPIVSSGIVFSPTQAYIVTGKNGNTDLLDTIDERLSQMKADENSEYYQLLDFWFSSFGHHIFTIPKWVYPTFTAVVVIVLFLLLLLIISKLRAEKASNMTLMNEKKFDDEISKAELNFRMIANYNLDWEVWLSPDSHFIYCSPSCYEHTGYESKEFMEDHELINSIIHPEDLQKWKNHSAHNSENIVNETFRIIRKNGEVNWFEHKCQHIFNDKGNFIGHRGSFKNITEQKKYEQALLESEEKYRIIIENSGDHIWVVDLDLNITFANGTLKLLTGNEKTELIGKKVRYVFKNTDINIITFILKKCIEEKKPHNFNIFFEENEFDEEHVLSTIATPYIVGGKVVSVICYSRDISEKHNLELQIQKSQRLESLGTLTGGIAHDFNNLLTPILGYSELILDLDKNNSEQQHYAKQIIEASLRAKDLVNKLLTFSKERKVQYKPIDVNRIIGDFISLLKSTLRSNINLIINFTPSNPVILGDRGQFEQILMNMAINAQDAIQGAGEIIIETNKIVKDQKNDMEYASMLPIGNYCQITIKDNGCGMSEEIKDRIFDPFYSTKGNNGSGLGLSTCFGIIKQLHGFILVDSKEGSGTKFDIFLPIEESTSEWMI
jgi:PAS domain S-box-containing protein